LPAIQVRPGLHPLHPFRPGDFPVIYLGLQRPGEFVALADHRGLFRLVGLANGFKLRVRVVPQRRVDPGAQLFGGLTRVGQRRQVVVPAWLPATMAVETGKANGCVTAAMIFSCGRSGRWSLLCPNCMMPSGVMSW